MPNADTERAYENASQAQLGERVTNLGRRQSDLESEMRSGFKQVESSISSLANETRNAIASVSASIAERNKPQWQALGVALTFATVLGGLAYMPIREATTDLKSSVSTLADRALSVGAFQDFKATYENNRIVSRTEYIDKFGAVNISIGKINDQLVPRAELERVWVSEDQQRAQMQKQIDELKQGQASTYSARDVILDMRERLDRMERARLGPGGS